MVFKNIFSIMRFKVLDICESAEKERVVIINIKKKFYYYENVLTKSIKRLQYRIFESKFNKVADIDNVF